MARQREVTRKPASPNSRIVLHLDAEDHRLLKIEAARQDRTVNGMARYLVKLGLKDVQP